MFTLVLLLLTATGLRAVPIGLRGLEKTSSASRLLDGSEPADILQLVPDGYRQGFVRSSLGNGFGEMERKHWLTDDEHLVDVPAQRKGNGWLRVSEPADGPLPDGFRQGTEPFMSIPEGFRQGTEPFMSIPEGFRQGTEPSGSIPEGFRQGTEPFMSIPEGFRQGTEPFMSIPEGFRQGTEPSGSIPEGFRQGTEPFMSIPEGFRQGTEPFMSIPEGFRQGTEPFMSIPEGFRQGTEPFMSIPEGFRQGTEPFMSIPEGFRQGTEPSGSISEGFRQGTQPIVSRLQMHAQACKGEVVDGKCYEFVAEPLTFQEAQYKCRTLAPNAELASVINGNLHSRLVSMVTDGGKSSPPLTWLGATVENRQGRWVDGSAWTYSDWMPGQPGSTADKPACVEMFRIDESWWSAADCDLRRASVCSYPVAA